MLQQQLGTGCWILILMHPLRQQLSRAGKAGACDAFLAHPFLQVQAKQGAYSCIYHWALVQLLPV